MLNLGKFALQVQEGILAKDGPFVNLEHFWNYIIWLFRAPHSWNGRAYSGTNWTFSKFGVLLVYTIHLFRVPHSRSSRALYGTDWTICTFGALLEYTIQLFRAPHSCSGRAYFGTLCLKRQGSKAPSAVNIFNIFDSYRNSMFNLYGQQHSHFSLEC